MRNLKKVLSLALAMVMLLGMMVVGAGATSFKDDSSIPENRSVAVAVANKIEVLLGDENGNFNPDNTLTRAEAAVVLAKLDLGADAAKALVATGAASFDDVGTGYGWAKAYIDYCAGNGYMVGVGGNKFAPARTLTSVEFATMVCRVLGYKDENEYGKDGWTAVKAAALARKAGLGADVAIANADMSRADMAQMVLNALTAPMVEYEGLNISVEGVAITSNLKVRTHTGSLANNNTTYDYQPIQSNITPIRLCEEKFPDLKLGKDEDAFGRVESVWTWKRVNIAGSEQVVAANFEFHDYMTSVSLNGATGDGNTLIYVDGKLESAAGKTINASFVAGKTANGRLVQVYLNDSNHKDIDKIVVVNTYVARVSAVSSANETTTVATMSAPSSLKSRTVKVTGFSTGDIVSYTAAWDGKTYEIQADDVTALTNPVTGTLTKWTGSSVETTDKGGSQANFSIDDGDPYQYSVNKVIRESDGSDAEISAFTAKKSELQVYLDQYGYAIYVVGVESEKNYAAVIGVGGTNAYGSETKGVTLLLPDGTTVEATAKLAGNAKWDTLKGTTENGSAVDKWDGSTYKNLVTDGVADIVTYTVDSKGVYTLTLAEHPAKNNTTKTGSYVKNTEAASSNGYTFVNGKSAMTMPGQPDFYTTSKTIFMVATNDANGNKTYGVYTGYANAPSIKANSGTTVKGVSYALNSTYHNQIDVVYIDATTVDGATAANTYFVKSASPYVYTDSTGKYFVLPAIIDGEVTTIKIDAGLVQNWDNKGDKALIDAPAGVYTIESVRKNDDDIVTSCAVKTESAAFRATVGKKVGTRAANSEVLGWGSTAPYTFYAYNDNTRVFYVDKDYKEISAMAVTDVQTDGNDLIFADYDSGTSKKLTSVVIVEQPETANTAPTEPGNTETTIGNITVVTPDAWGATQVNARIVNHKINVSFKVSENIAAFSAAPQGTVNSHDFEIEAAKNTTVSLPNVTYVTTNNDYTTDESYTVVFTGTVSSWKVTWSGVSDAAKTASTANLTATAATNVPVLKMAAADLASYNDKVSFDFKVEGIDLTVASLAANTAKGVEFSKSSGTGTATVAVTDLLSTGSGLPLFTAGVKATGPVTVTISNMKDASEKVKVAYALASGSEQYADLTPKSLQLELTDTATGAQTLTLTYKGNLTKANIAYAVNGTPVTTVKNDNQATGNVSQATIPVTPKKGEVITITVTVTPTEYTVPNVIIPNDQSATSKVDSLKVDPTGKVLEQDLLTGGLTDSNKFAVTINGKTEVLEVASNNLKIPADKFTLPVGALTDGRDIVVKVAAVYAVSGSGKVTGMSDTANADRDYALPTQTQATAAGLKGTGVIYTVGGGTAKYAAFGTSIPKAEITGAIVITKDYVKVTVTGTPTHNVSISFASGPSTPMTAAGTGYAATGSVVTIASTGTAGSGVYAKTTGGVTELDGQTEIVTGASSGNTVTTKNDADLTIAVSDSTIN